MSLGLRRIFVVMVCMITLSACVTSYDRPQQNIDLEKAKASHLKLGLQYLRQNNLRSSRFHFNKALKIDAKFAGAYAGLAELMLREGDADRAEQFFKKSIGLNAEYALVRNNYGSFLFQRKRYDEALKQFILAANNLDYDRRPMAFVNTGLSHVRLGDLDSAEAAFVRALNLDLNMSRAFLEMSDIAYIKGEYPAANQLMSRYQHSGSPTPRSLLLQIKIARKLDDKNQESSARLALKNLYPRSDEFRTLSQGL